VTAEFLPILQPSFPAPRAFTSGDYDPR
jgi:hypothetical protein